MANSIGDINLNFQILDTGDPEYILLKDFSKWRVIENMPAYMEITLPGARNPITLPFEKHATNAYNSLSLGITCHIDCEKNTAPLNDGIYEFCLRGGANGNHKKHRYYLKKDRLQEDLDKLWIKLGLDYSEENKAYRNKLLYIEGFLNASEAATRRGFIPKANDYFKLAQIRIKSLIECKDCI